MIGIELGVSLIDKADRRALKRNAREFRAPFLAGRDGKGAGERSGRHDFASSERRTEPILRQRLGEMAQRKQRPVEDVGREAVIDWGSVAEKIDLEARKLARPRIPTGLGRMTGSDEKHPMEAVGGDGVRR